ncbi:TPA: glycosyltransferase family 2 protein, partial [Clostridioides difficile]
MADTVLLLSILSIWISVTEAIIIMAGAIRFIHRQEKQPIEIPANMDHFPTVSVLVPAHNEGLVIVSTVEHILRLNYPEHKVQVIVIADNCTDDTAERLKKLKANTSYAERDFTILERTGAGGKSGALNDALQMSTGEWICVYDA